MIFVLLVVGLVVLGCTSRSFELPAEDPIAAGEKPLPAETDYERQRAAMVQRHLRGRDISDPLVLQAKMQKVPRHEFVPKQLIAI